MIKKSRVRIPAMVQKQVLKSSSVTAFLAIIPVPIPNAPTLLIKFLNNNAIPNKPKSEGAKNLARITLALSRTKVCHPPPTNCHRALFPVLCVNDSFCFIPSLKYQKHNFIKMSIEAISNMPHLINLTGAYDYSRKDRSPLIAIFD